MAKPARDARSGFAITYETSLLTLITFTISIATLVWQIVNYLEGPQVKLITPAQITIAPSGLVQFPNRDGGPFVHFIADMGYVNEASAGYNATIRTERLRITVAGAPTFEYAWYYTVVSDAGGPQGLSLVVTKKAPSHPLPLPAGSSQSHETLFQPWLKDCSAVAAPCKPDDNYVDWKTFVGWFQKTGVINFEFMLDVFGRDEPLSEKCTVRMSPAELAIFVQRGWGSPFCTAE
jgi:hypothetical protein